MPRATPPGLPLLDDEPLAALLQETLDALLALRIPEADEPLRTLDYVRGRLQARVDAYLGKNN